MIKNVLVTYIIYNIFKFEYYKKNAINKLWKMREVTQFNLNYQVKVEQNNKIDLSNQKFFSFVNPNFKNKYKDFIKLLNNYNIYLKDKEEYTENELNEIDLFLENVLKSESGKYMIDIIKFLKSKNTKKEIKEFLFEIWFEIYDRKSNKVLDSCGFEHVFIGELYSKSQPGKLGGYHNWIKFYLDEEKGLTEYYGYLIDSNLNIATIQLSHQEVFKKISGFFLGIDPYTEFCIFTVAFISRGKFSIFNVDNKKIKIVTYPYYDKYISTAFPKLI